MPTAPTARIADSENVIFHGVTNSHCKNEIVAMSPVALTDTVTITYTTTLDNGEEIDRSPRDRPITLSIGRGRLFPAVEVALLGMEPGETRTVRVQPEDGYGLYHKELVHTLPRSSFGDRINPQPGMILALKIEKDGETKQVPATVLSVSDDQVVVDYNHPLAGKVLNYTVTLVGINR